MATRRALLAALFASCITTLPAHAAEFSGKPMRLIVPYTPGGSSDLVARLLADRLQTELSQRIIVENRPGAGGILGTDLGGQAAPDGHTLTLSYTGTFSILPNLQPKMPYDPLTTFNHVSTVSAWSYLLVVHPSLPARSVQELIALAAKRPGELNYGSSGNGSVPHFAGALFASMAKIKMTHIPYKGGGPAMVDVLAGQLQLYFASGPISIPHVKTGRLRLLASTSLQRSKLNPDVPTISELGVKGYEITAWYGVAVPAKTPQANVEALHKAIVRVTNAKDYADRLAVHGIEPAQSAPGELASTIKREMAVYARIVKEANVKAE